MAGRVDRLDVQLELAEATGNAEIKTGAQVTLLESDGGVLEVLSPNDVVLGTVPEEHRAALSSGRFQSHIRTLKRDAATGTIRGILVRFVRGAAEIIPAGKM